VIARRGLVRRTLLAALSSGLGLLACHHQVPLPRAPEAPASVGQLPGASGVYYLTPAGLRPLVGRGVVFHQLKVGPFAQRESMQIPGGHAYPELDSAPVFYYRQEGDERPGAINLVLARLKVSHGHRELQESVAAQGGEVETGVSVSSQVQVYITRVSDTIYKIIPADDLRPGEYAFYVRTSHEHTQDAYLYDFSVSQ
jgi:hypothetical protein